MLGADISQQSVARARERIAAAGLAQAEVICADVSSHAFAPQAFDLAFSRLGVMFFDNPTAAFTNVHRAMKPTGRLAAAVFRPAKENPWPNAPLGAVRNHPLVRTHPETGAKTLYIGNHASHVLDMPEAEGEVLLLDLLEHATQPQFVYTHHWRDGDLVMWDNRCLLHRALANYEMTKHRRVLHRTVVTGTAPF